MFVAASAFDHVLDTRHWHFFDNNLWHFSWELPRIFDQPWLALTKYKILMIVVALLILAIYIPMGRAVQSGKPPRGLFWNAFESILTFIRDNLAKPYMGHDADRYVHYLWTVFIFILFCNLFGLFPFMGSPTASFTVTLALATVTFFFIHGSAAAKMGLGTYVKSFFPHLDVPFPLNYFIGGLIFFLETAGSLIKAFVLAVRLFANMFAGHVVLAFILLFIVEVREMNASPVLFWGVTISSVIGVTLLSLLELFVAFLQAYVFTFLTALFLGSALHPHH